MRDQQHNAEHERHDHQNGVQRLHLGQKNVDQPERTAKERQDAEGSVEVVLFVLTAPAGAGAIVKIPDAAV